MHTFEIVQELNKSTVDFVTPYNSGSSILKKCVFAYFKENKY